MAARKIKAPKSTSSEARAFAVVVEEMRSHFKVFGEEQQLFREQQAMLRQEMTAGFAAVRQEMTAGLAAVREEMTAGFGAVRREMATGFARVENDVAELRQDMGLVKIAVLEHSRELKEIRVALDKKVDRDEVEGIVQRVVAGGR